MYRIDHFLGKEATQDLHMLRFANGLFASSWDREYIESVQIDVPETLDINDRAVFYDATGAVLDMMVTHLFQLAAEVAMEPPASLGAMDLQAAREEVIGCFRVLDPAEVVLGQYDHYRDVPGVDPHSNQNTFVAARLWVDNDRWRGVPFYLRTGKELAVSAQRVSLILRDPPGPLSGQLPAGSNVLCFSLAGDGEIDLSLVTKKPGPGIDLDVAHASIQLASLKDADPLPAYVRLIHDVLLGDRSLFTRPDGLASVWKVAQPLLSSPPEVKPYATGIVGASRGGPAHRPRTLAPRPVTQSAADHATDGLLIGELPDGGPASTHHPPVAVESLGFKEANPRQRTTLHPLVEHGNSPRAVGTMAVVELVDEVREHLAPLGRIGDDLGLGRQVGHHAVLQMEGEVRVGGQVGQPVPGAGPGNPAQVDRIFESVEDDLDSPRLPRTSAGRGDVDRSVLHRRGPADRQRRAHVTAHQASRPVALCAARLPAALPAR